MKPQVTWARIPAAPATAAAGGRRAPPGACRVRGREESQEGAPSSPVATSHLQWAQQRVQAEAAPIPPSALSPARGTQLAPAEVAGWSVADLQGDVCMSHHPGPLPCGWRRGWGWGGNKPSALENSEPAQPRPRLSCAVSPALSPETGCCPRSDVTAAEPTAPAAPPPWGGAFRARSQRKTRVRPGAGSGMGDVTAQGDPRSMRAGTAAPSPRPSTEPLRGLRETTPDRRSGHPTKLHRVKVKPPLTLRAEAFGEACPWDLEGVTRESGGLGSLCVSTRARP